MAEKKNTNICWENEKDNLDRMINQEHKSYIDISKFYNISPSTIRRKISELGLKRKHNEVIVNRKFSYSVDELNNAVKESFSKSEVCKKLGIEPVGRNITSIGKRIKELGLDDSHFTGQLHNKGKHDKKTPLKDLLVENSNYNSSRLKERLIEEKLKEKKCELCGETHKLGKPIPLQLHHINGDHFDNRLENLQILCPTCHAMTENFNKPKLSKNEGRYIKIPEKELIQEKFKELIYKYKVAEFFNVSIDTLKSWIKYYNLDI